MKLSTDQQALVDQFGKAYAAHKAMEVSAFARHRSLAESEVSNSARQLSAFAHEIRSTGVRKAALVRAIGHTGTSAIDKLLAIYEQREAPATPSSGAVTFAPVPDDAGLVEVRLDPLAFPDHTAPAGAPEWSGLYRATPRESDGKVFFDPARDEDKRYSEDREYDHPVTEWLLDYPENEDRLREWWEAR